LQQSIIKTKEYMHKKKTRIVAGIMSGTSLDGIDCVIMHIGWKQSAITWKLLAHVHRKFPAELSDALKRNSDPATSRIDEINDLNQALPYYYADAVKRAGSIAGENIELIGCHGQTVYHRPDKVRRYGKRFGATLQIGDPSTLAVLTGIPVVGNFRSADIALGGQGAPLVPYADYLMYRDTAVSRLMLNIGGIANFTLLPRNASPSRVVAFDTGPGNMVIDSLMKEYFGKNYDKNGSTARRGTANESLFMKLIQHPYLQRKPPKSTGREEFGTRFLSKLKQYIPSGCSPEDVITTVSEFTAWSIFYSYSQFMPKGAGVDEVIVSGGGAKNKYIMDALNEYFETARIMTSDDTGLPVEAKEAACFAVLANETADGRSGNLPSVTGASKKVRLGVIAYP
jgi:anhydro-N-acetylmuramic acid kinase